MIHTAFRSLACLIVALLVFVGAAGCAGPQTDLKVTSIASRQTYRQPFTQAYYRRDGLGNVDVVVVDDAAQQNLSGQRTSAPVRQIMHIRVLWVPSRDMKAVASNASIKWYVIGDSNPQDVLEYSGSGFVAVNQNGDMTSVSVQNAVLHPSDKHGSLVDPVGHAKIKGTIVARAGEAAVRQLLNDLHTALAAASEPAHAAAMP
jgi:hypothetical protein